MRELEPLITVLTAHDRCDARACGARAYIRATFPAGPLYFCGHHGHEYMSLFVELEAVVLDETSQIGDKRAGL
jgi:hypothetical protein